MSLTPSCGLWATKRNVFEALKIVYEMGAKIPNFQLPVSNVVYTRDIENVKHGTV